jgi:GNAT superfamily N-acetyltransferase
MPLRFELDPPVTAGLRDAITRIWVEATNAGGAIGFVAPVEPETVALETDHALDGVAEGLDRLLVGYDGDQLAAVVFIVDRRFALMDHIRTLKRVMVDPKFQGNGYGVALLREAEKTARTLVGVEMLHLTLRGGQGLERFYAKCGYTEVGRMPRALRVAADDYREEVTMTLSLSE